MGLSWLTAKLPVLLQSEAGILVLVRTVGQFIFKNSSNLSAVLGHTYRFFTSSLKHLMINPVCKQLALKHSYNIVF